MHMMQRRFKYKCILKLKICFALQVFTCMTYIWCTKQNYVVRTWPWIYLINLSIYTDRIYLNSIPLVLFLLSAGTSYELINVSLVINKDFSGNASVPIWKSLGGSVLKLFLLLLSPAAWVATSIESQELLANNKDLKFPYFKFVREKIYYLVSKADIFHENLDRRKKKNGVFVCLSVWKKFEIYLIQ